jgi:hypothetical protein
MADIDQIIAGGAKTNADFDFGKINRAYWEGKDQAAKNDLREAFKGGVPTLPDGTPDFGSMAKTLFQKGGLSEGTALIGAAIGPAERAKLDSIDGGQIVSPPSANRTATAVVAPPLNKGGEQKQGQGLGDQPTVMKILAAQGIPNDQLGAASQSLARQLGVDPTAPLNLQDPQVRNVLAPAVAQIKQMNLGQVQPPQPGDNPQVMGAPPLQGSPAQVAAQNDPILKRLTLLTASPDKATAAAAKVRLESYLKNQEATTEMKNAAASGQNLPAYQEKQGELAAQQAGATERAKVDVAEQQDYIKGGKTASDRLTTLNTISNIIGSDDKMKMGFGAETGLKVQMALKSLGVDVGDLSGPQAIQKLNAVLASESAKGVGARPTQFEFKTFLANNPGLSMDKAGNERVIGIYSQLAKREVDLGRLARQNQDNWSNWDNVVEKYDKSHPIKDPSSGKVITTDSIVAPGPKQGTQPAGARQFSSPSDVHAAIAAGQLKKGDTFTDPNGKTRMVP